MTVYENNEWLPSNHNYEWKIKINILQNKIYKKLIKYTYYGAMYTQYYCIYVLPCQ